MGEGEGKDNKTNFLEDILGTDFVQQVWSLETFCQMKSDSKREKRVAFFRDFYATFRIHIYVH